MAETLFEKYIKLLPLEIVQLLEACEQDPIHHKEGNVLIHTKMVFSQVVHRHGPDAIVLLLSAIFHDLGKPETTEVTIDANGNQKITHHEHEGHVEAFIDMYIDLFDGIIDGANKNTKFYFIRKFWIRENVKKKVRAICANHMRAHLFMNGVIKKRSKIIDFHNLPDFNDIIAFSICDELGRIK